MYEENMTAQTNSSTTLVAHKRSTLVESEGVLISF